MEMVIEHMLKFETSIVERQFGFMPRRFTIVSIYLLRGWPNNMRVQLKEEEGD